MEIIKENKLNKLIANEGYLLKDKNDNYKPSYIDEDGNKTEESLPCAFEYAYLPDSISLEMAQSMYDELLASEYPWKKEEINSENAERLWEEVVLNGLK